MRLDQIALKVENALVAGAVGLAVVSVGYWLGMKIFASRPEGWRHPSQGLITSKYRQLLKLDPALNLWRISPRDHLFLEPKIIDRLVDFGVDPQFINSDEVGKSGADPVKQLLHNQQRALIFFDLGNFTQELAQYNPRTATHFESERINAILGCVANIQRKDVTENIRKILESTAV